VSILNELRAARNIYDLASLLGYKPKSISYILYKIPKAAKYTTFDIKKKDGSERRIDAPTPKLKGLQKRLAIVLYECLRELEATDKRKNKLSHAFRSGYSIITNAKAHKSRRYVLNLDLKDFFPTLNFGRVRGFFLNNRQFRLAEPVATMVSQIACNDGVLPQGSPCSPILSELVTHFLDIRLVKLADRNKCSYTRYADDITFSTNQKEFPKALAFEKGTSWILGKELISRIEDAGFQINAAKTRMQVRGSRQTVTGLTVNTKVNVSQDYYKLARAMTYSFLTTGSYKRDGVVENSVQRLEGILNHIYHIRERQIDIAIDAVIDEAKREKIHRDRTKQKNEYPSAIRSVYVNLVFFKHFIDPSKPLIVCEGPSDRIYLKSAIRKLAAAHPRLVSTKAGTTSVNLNFFRYSKQSKDLLQLRGGTPDLKYFLESWPAKFAKFSYRPVKHAVIILIDNDDGPVKSGLFNLLKGGKFNIKIDLATDQPFYHLGGPLYLIKTPLKGKDYKSRIEDFFDPSLLKTKLDGKTFNPDKDHDAPGEYGKVRFAEAVVRPLADKIDFSGFDPLLNRIDAVLADYDKRVAPPPAPSTAATTTTTTASPKRRRRHSGE
jgi:RNA-directed DNA polymerase